MKALLEYLRQRSITLTVYNYEGSDERLEALSGAFSGSGVAVATDTTSRGTPTNLGVLHRGDEVFGARSVDEWEADDDFTAAFGAGSASDRAEIPPLPTDGMTVSPETSRQRMIGISRTFERRALREGGGRLISGFQNLSTISDSEETRSVYDRLIESGVTVTVCGYPDAAIEDQSFDVFEDTDEKFRGYWFLLYDGNGNDSRKAALVSREREPSLYDSFWTTDPETGDELLALGTAEYPELF